jgi:hypothetical protein
VERRLISRKFDLGGPGRRAASRCVEILAIGVLALAAPALPAHSRFIEQRVRECAPERSCHPQQHTTQECTDRDVCTQVPQSRQQCSSSNVCRQEPHPVTSCHPVRQCYGHICQTFPNCQTVTEYQPVCEPQEHCVDVTEYRRECRSVPNCRDVVSSTDVCETHEQCHWVTKEVEAPDTPKASTAPDASRWNSHSPSALTPFPETSPNGVSTPPLRTMPPAHAGGLGSDSSPTPFDREFDEFFKRHGYSRPLHSAPMPSPGTSPNAASTQPTRTTPSAGLNPSHASQRPQPTRGASPGVSPSPAGTPQFPSDSVLYPRPKPTPSESEVLAGPKALPAERPIAYLPPTPAGHPTTIGAQQTASNSAVNPGAKSAMPGKNSAVVGTVQPSPAGTPPWFQMAPSGGAQLNPVPNTGSCINRWTTAGYSEPDAQLWCLGSGANNPYDNSMVATTATAQSDPGQAEAPYMSDAPWQVYQLPYYESYPSELQEGLWLLQTYYDTVKRAGGDVINNVLGAYGTDLNDYVTLGQDPDYSFLVGAQPPPSGEGELDDVISPETGKALDNDLKQGLGLSADQMTDKLLNRNPGEVPEEVPRGAAPNELPEAPTSGEDAEDSEN